MKQKTKHPIDLKAFDKYCTEVHIMLSLCLDRDRFQRQRCIPQDVMRYIHNEALFGCIRTVNSTASIKSIKEYLRFADTLKPKFFEIVEALRNFQPTGTIAKE